MIHLRIFFQQMPLRASLYRFHRVHRQIRGDDSVIVLDFQQSRRLLFDPTRRKQRTCRNPILLHNRRRQKLLDINRLRKLRRRLRRTFLGQMTIVRTIRTILAITEWTVLFGVLHAHGSPNRATDAAHTCVFTWVYLRLLYHATSILFLTL